MEEKLLGRGVAAQVSSPAVRIATAWLIFVGVQRSIVGCTLFMWGAFGLFMANWVYYRFGRSWFGQRFLDLAVVGYFLRNPENPLFAGTRPTASTGSATPGIDVVPSA
jgi:hypothetical protein